MSKTKTSSGKKIKDMDIGELKDAKEASELKVRRLQVQQRHELVRLNFINKLLYGEQPARELTMEVIEMRLGHKVIVKGYTNEHSEKI